MQSQNQLLFTWNVQTSWKSSEIGFFYSDISISWKCKDVVNRKDKIYYKSIIIFTNRFRITASIRNAIKICQNFNICLCEKTEKWWINKLDELVHAKFIIHHNDVKQWCKILKKHWKAVFLNSEKSSDITFMLSFLADWLIDWSILNHVILDLH